MTSQPTQGLFLSTTRLSSPHRVHSCPQGHLEITRLPSPRRAPSCPQGYLEVDRLPSPLNVHSCSRTSGGYSFSQHLTLLYNVRKTTIVRQDLWRLHSFTTYSRNNKEINFDFLLCLGYLSVYKKPRNSCFQFCFLKL